MVNPNSKTFGGKPKPVAVLGRDGWPVSSSCGLYVTPDEGTALDSTCGGPACGEFSGGNWITACRLACSLAPPTLLLTHAKSVPPYAALVLETVVCSSVLQ
jgi:hypothetical protein